jgi:hypothetical protein
MSTQNTAHRGEGARPGGAPLHSDSANRAYRRAWWSLALYPVTFVAAFVIGEGLYSVFNGDQGNAAWWEILLAATSAILVFVIPGILAWTMGRTAVRLGRTDGNVPAVVGAAIAIGFAGLNLLSGLLQLIVG